MQDNWIRKQREELGISQFKMAKALNVPSHILSAWELGKKKPDNAAVNLLNDFFSNHQKYFKINGVSKSKKRFARDTKADTSILTGNKEQVKKFHNRNKPPKFKTSNELKAVMLFSGIGGMSLGFKKAGYKIIYHVEINDAANNIYELNFPGAIKLGKDIRSISDTELKQIKRNHGEIAVIAGGPPCQGFSLAGKRNIHDPRNELFQEFVRFSKHLKPKAILIENVRMLLSMTSKDRSKIIGRLIKAFEDAGYKLTYKTINAKEYGIPQSRERVIFVGLRNDIAKKHNPCFPEPTHGNAGTTLFKGMLSPYKTFRDATKDLESLESGELSSTDPWHFAIDHPPHVIKMLEKVPEGKSAHDNSDTNLRPPSGYNTTYKRIKWDEPCSTISTNFSMISGSRNVHPSDTRSLTIREAMRCQTFPDYFVLDGNLGEIRRGIGNAVPPSLAEILANHLKNYIISFEIV